MGILFLFFIIAFVLCVCVGTIIDNMKILIISAIMACIIFVVALSYAVFIDASKEIKISVTNGQGEEIYFYEGNAALVEYKNNYLSFRDNEGKEHIMYCGDNVVLIEEM